ncbi:MAG: 16S rRNA (guanine(527)-N(7))-methyltransferase RsmG [Ruminococcaceae bacterium]|nr:16S rRNA (guanine(527)-N(7))-methyltransferase RsmG [Oscillospiraceae bacterium]
MIDRERMRAKAAQYGITVTDAQLEQLDTYAALLVEWNERMNLTSILEPEEIETKHFLDCMLAARLCKAGESIADVGTGAGFPGVVMKIMQPEIDITLIDSLEKRLTFLSEVGSQLKIGMNYIHARAEDAGHADGLREAFAATTARAVAPLNVLAEYCLPLTAVGGRLIAMKGRSAADEVESAMAAIELLGGKIADEQEFTLPDGSERQIIVIEKIAATPEKYPRRANAIKKKPL